MKSFFEWFAEKNINQNTPWLILGKGPSFAKKAHYDLTPFLKLSLNHVVREQQVTAAHIIDYDVVADCAEAIDQNAEVLVMPWHPHQNHTCGQETLADLAERDPFLRGMNEQGRLLWYNLRSARKRIREGSPIVHVRYFSAEAGLSLLATAGVKTVRSLGIDGGNTYSGSFDDLKDKTLLANGRQSFDKQFEEFPKIILQTGVDYAPLDVESPVRVYVGSTESELLSVKVLEYSIKKHATMSVEVFPMFQSEPIPPMPVDPKKRPRTPFSFQRFTIPERAGYRGRAIYMDADMQLMTDIRKLWSRDFQGADLLACRAYDPEDRRPQFSVMLLNCDELRWNIHEIVAALNNDTLSYEKLMYEMTVAREVRAEIPPGWNALERYDEGETCLIHYTDMPTQPWVSKRNPLERIWLQDLFEAVDAGFVSMDLIRDHIQRSYLRPSLLYQAERRILNSKELPKKILNLDHGFQAPYTQLTKHKAAMISEPVKKRWYDKLFASIKIRPGKTVIKV